MCGYRQILKSTVSSEAQSPHEIWKSSPDHNWVGSSIINSPIKVDANIPRSSSNSSAVPDDLMQSTVHWSKASQDGVNNTTVSQASSLHSFRFVTKPITNILIKPNVQTQPGKFAVDDHVDAEFTCHNSFATIIY